MLGKIVFNISEVATFFNKTSKTGRLLSRSTCKLLTSDFRLLTLIMSLPPPLFSLLLVFLALSTVNSNAQTESIAQKSNILDTLPSNIQDIVILTPQDPISYRMDCRVRSFSSRSVNITHFPFDGDSVSVRLESKTIETFGVRINDTLKINEVLLFGSGDDAIEIMGVELDTYHITENSVSFITNVYIDVEISVLCEPSYRPFSFLADLLRLSRRLRT
jgi:hypothetical protein